MRLRSIALAAAVAAGLITAAPAAAQADVIKHITCQNNNLHYTAADLYLRSDYQELDKVVWNTNAAFHPDRITWAAFIETGGGNEAWYLVAAVGGSSATHGDVAPTGTVPDTQIISVAAPLHEWRMTVFSSAMGDCQAYFIF